LACLPAVYRFRDKLMNEKYADVGAIFGRLDQSSCNPCQELVSDGSPWIQRTICRRSKYKAEESLYSVRQARPSMLRFRLLFRLPEIGADGLSEWLVGFCLNADGDLSLLALPDLRPQHPAARRFSQALAGDGCASSIFAGPPPSTNVALSCRSLDPACALLRPAWSRLLGPRLLEQRHQRHAQSIGQHGDDLIVRFSRPAFDSLNELQRVAQRLGKLLLRPSTASRSSPTRLPTSRTSWSRSDGPHDQHGAADAW
jgi:hypothetical protein